LSKSSRTESATPVVAILYVLTCGVLFACLDASAKYLVVSGMSSLFTAWMRFAVHVIFVLIMLRCWSNPAVFAVSSIPIQLLRGVCLFGSTILNFAALKTLQLAETSAIFFSAPMVITALAGPLLGEWAGWRRWLAVLGGFLGVIVITRPGLGAFHIGHAYALTATLSYCFYIVLTRKVAHRETPESLLFYSALAPVVLMAPTVPFTVTAPVDLFHGAILLGMGVFGGVGHWLLIRAHKLASAMALAPYPYMQMVWMIGFGYFVFDQFPDRWTLAGSAIVVASGLYIVHRERSLRLQNPSTPVADTASREEKL
jgi:drug/metabolite transporter (DMT)-like permease